MIPRSRSMTYGLDSSTYNTCQLGCTEGAVCPHTRNEKDETQNGKELKLFLLPRCCLVGVRFDFFLHWFAISRSTSAWHRSSGLHQHARFLPYSFSASHSRKHSTESSTVGTAIYCPAATLLPGVWLGATENGFPHLPGRDTLTVFGGRVEPPRRLSWVRFGMPAFPSKLIVISIGRPVDLV